MHSVCDRVSLCVFVLLISKTEDECIKNIYYIYTG